MKIYILNKMYNIITTTINILAFILLIWSIILLACYNLI